MTTNLRPLALLLFPCLLASAQTPPRRIYLAPDDHTDYMWSGDEETYRRAFIEMIDYYLDLADKTAQNPPEHQSRWNCDGSVWMWTYEHNKAPAEFERLMRRVRDGHISMPLTASVSCYGAIPAEAVLRGMYYAGRLERRYGVRFPLAVAMEDQTIPYGLGAICGCASVFEKTAHDRRPHEVYWWRGPDGSRLLMKWNTMLGDNKSMGGYAEAFDPAASLAVVDSEPFKSIYPYPVVGIFGKGWDNLKTLTDEFVTVARAQTNDARKVIVSNEVDFFQDLERTAGAKLPVFEGGFGNEWDTYSASMAEVSARVRRSVEGLRAAEALATLVSLKRPDFLAGRASARDQAWMSLGLYWDHDWTSDSPVLRREAKAAWQRKTAGQVEAYADSLLADASYALGGLIRKTCPMTARFRPMSSISKPVPRRRRRRFSLTLGTTSKAARICGFRRRMFRRSATRCSKSARARRRFRVAVRRRQAASSRTSTTASKSPAAAASPASSINPGATANSPTTPSTISVPAGARSKSRTPARYR